ncbi:zinc finger protein 84-like isoform X2 [Ambystoma mexicanum]
METDANRTQDIYLPGSKIDNCDVLFGINRDENQYLKDCQEMDERIINDSFSTAFPVSNFENVLRLEHELQSSLMASEDADGAMSGPHPSSVQETVFPVISVKIKQEEEAYSVDHQNFEKTEPIYIQRALPFSNTEPATSFTEDADGPESSIVHATDYAAIQRRRQTRSTIKKPETPLCNASSRKVNVNLLEEVQKGCTSESQMSAENNQVPGGANATSCEISFRKPVYSNLHQRTTKAVISSGYDECGSNVSNVTLGLSPQNTDQNWRQYTDSEYEKNISLKGILVKPKTSTTKGKQYICSVCGKTFTQMGNLLRHQTIHFGQKPYKCTECEKSFSQKVHFIRHQRTHSGERPYQCTECMKSFSRKESLLAHKRTHTGDRPYQCLECGKSYSVKQSLIFHQRKHSGEKPYQCTICDKKFSWKQNFIGHQRTHMTAEPKSTNLDTC